MVSFGSGAKSGRGSRRSLIRLGNTSWVACGFVMQHVEGALFKVRKATSVYFGKPRPEIQRSWPQELVASKALAETTDIRLFITARNLSSKVHGVPQTFTVFCSVSCICFMTSL